MKSKHSNTWYNKVAHLKKQINVHSPIYQTKNGIKNYRKRILTHMTKKYEDYWHKELNRETSKSKNKGGNKLRTYKILKQNFHLEPYLNHIDNTEHRRAVTQLRLSSHSLNIESLRGSIHDPEQRKCDTCTLDEKEDEIHFIMRCQRYNAQRQKLLSMMHQNINNTSPYNDTHWYIFLMTNEDKTICKALGKYIYECMTIRKLARHQPSTV